MGSDLCNYDGFGRSYGEVQGEKRLKEENERLRQEAADWRAKLRGLLVGLQCQNVDEALDKFSVADFQFSGDQMGQRIMGKINDL